MHSKDLKKKQISPINQTTVSIITDRLEFVQKKKIS